MIKPGLDNNNNGKSALEIVNESRKDLVNRVVEHMEQLGEVPWRKSWSNCVNIPHNPLSKVAQNGYHGGNRMRLMLTAMLNNYEDPRWVTAKQAMDAGMHVKKGEHGTLLERWVYGKETERINPETSEKEVVFVPFREPVVNFFRVFNAQQIEGMEPLAEYQQKYNRLDVTKEAELDDVISNLHASSECMIINEYQNQAYYRPSSDEIHMPMPEQFESKASYIATLTHEMSHSTGAKSRLNRPYDTHFGSAEYAREEMRAELGAMFTMQGLGIPMKEPEFDNHAAYLNSWIEVLKTDYSELFKACNDADKISERLIENYEHVLGHGHGLEQVHEGGLSAQVQTEIDKLDDVYFAAFKLDSGDYLSVTVTDNYDLDYTIYKDDYREIDGGVLDIGKYEDSPIREHFKELCDFIGINPKSIERVDEEELDYRVQEVAEKDISQKRSEIFGHE